VAIRGTHGKENWAINFQAHALIAEFRPNLESDTTDCQKHKDEENEDHQRELCGDEDGCCIRGRVHRGQYEAINGKFNDQENLSKISAIFKKYDGESRVIFTGHSLGFGLAQFLVMDMMDITKRQKVIDGAQNPKFEKFLTEKAGTIEMFGFGGPAVMSQSMALAMRSAIADFNLNGPIKMLPIDKAGEESRWIYQVTDYVHVKDPVAFEGKAFLRWVKGDWLGLGVVGKLNLAYINQFGGYIGKIEKQMIENALKDPLLNYHIARRIYVENPAWMYKGYIPNIPGVDIGKHVEYLDMINDGMGTRLDQWLRDEKAVQNAQ